MTANNPDCILLCEECRNILSLKDMTTDSVDGYHVCRMKKYRETHYCESYVAVYEREKSK